MTHRTSDRHRASAPIWVLHLGATNLAKLTSMARYPDGATVFSELTCSRHSALSDEEMVLSQGLGNEARQADRHEQGEGRHRPEDRRNPPLHLGRRNILRVGPGKAGLIISCEILARFSTGRRCPAGTVVVVTSVNRRVAARPHSAGHVEAPDPDIIMRRCATSERTMTPATASRSTIGRSDHLGPRSRRLRNPDQLRPRERYRRAVGEFERSLTTNRN